MCVCNGSSAKILKFNNYSSLKEELEFSGSRAFSEGQSQVGSSEVFAVREPHEQRGAPAEELRQPQPGSRCGPCGGRAEVRRAGRSLSRGKERLEARSLPRGATKSVSSGPLTDSALAIASPVAAPLPRPTGPSRARLPPPCSRSAFPSSHSRISATVATRAPSLLSDRRNTDTNTKLPLEKQQSPAQALL